MLHSELCKIQELKHLGLCRSVVCHLGLCRIRGYVVWHNIAFGMMSHLDLLYVVRDCVVRRNAIRLKVVWRNVVLRNVNWPTVGVSCPHCPSLVSNNTDTLPRVISDY